MKKYLTAFVLMIVSAPVLAQIENPVKWMYSAKKVADKTYDIYVSATLDPKWHIYAQKAGEGPEPTSFRFDKNPLLKFEGAVKESGKLEQNYDPNFQSTLRYYSNKVDFIQRVKLKTGASTVVKGAVTYMVCNENRCLPPKEVPFSVKLDGK